MSGSGNSAARPASTEVEASSFSIWNCVITFLQILLISTMLYGTGWSQGQMYNITPDTIVRFQHFRAIAFFFCAWALQSVALALLLVWAIGKKSYHLCHSWILCEALMQIFIIVSAIYFTYRYLLFDDQRQFSNSTEDFTMQHRIVHRSSGMRAPKHLIFLIILHFLIKGFGFWIVSRYMKLIKNIGVEALMSQAINNSVQPTSSTETCNREMSPPPSYAYLCKDDLPCYDEAVRLCIESGKEDEESNNQSFCNSKVAADKTALVQV